MTSVEEGRTNDGATTKPADNNGGSTKPSTDTSGGCPYYDIASGLPMMCGPSNGEFFLVAWLIDRMSET